jgi:hypothetical protein
VSAYNLATDQDKEALRNYLAQKMLQELISGFPELEFSQLCKGCGCWFKQTIKTLLWRATLPQNQHVHYGRYTTISSYSPTRPVTLHKEHLI